LIRHFPYLKILIYLISFFKHTRLIVSIPYYTITFVLFQPYCMNKATDHSVALFFMRNISDFLVIQHSAKGTPLLHTSPILNSVIHLISIFLRLYIKTNKKEAEFKIRLLKIRLYCKRCLTADRSFVRQILAHCLLQRSLRL
jgi:hypothetical protein